MYKKADVKEIFDREKMLMGSMEEMPEYRAQEIFGKKAVDFAKKMRKGMNGYGIGDFTLDSLTLIVAEIAATYLNVSAARVLIEKKGGTLDCG